MWVVGRDVVVPRAPKGSPSVIFLPVPLVDTSVVVLSLADALSHDVLVLGFAQVDQVIELVFIRNIDLIGNRLENALFS